MLITTRTQQVPGWATTQGELKICRQHHTQGIWSRDHRPATRCLFEYIQHT